MKKIDLITKKELPKLFLGGISIFAISWVVIYLTSVLLVKLVANIFGSVENYSEMVTNGLPAGNAVFQLGFLSAIIILVALVILIVSVAYDEFFFSKEVKGVKKQLFWGLSWGLIFVIFDLIVGSICFNKSVSGNGYSCNTFSIADSFGVFYWFFVLLIIVLPIVSHHYGRAKASYKK